MLGANRQRIQFLFDFGNSVGHGPHSCTQSEVLSSQTETVRQAGSVPLNRLEAEHPRRHLRLEL